MGINIKKFRADSLQKAIEAVRDEMGDDAIILQTETIREKGAFGLSARVLVEVTAAKERKEELHKPAVATTPAPTKTSPATIEKKPWLQRLGFMSRPSDETKPQTVQGDQAKEVLQEGRELKEIQATMSTPSTNVQQLYAIKTFVEPLQREIDSLKGRLESSEQSKKEKTSLSLTSNGVRKRVFDPLENEIQKLRSDLHALLSEKRFSEMDLAPIYEKLYRYWTARGLTESQILSFFKSLEAQGINLEEKQNSVAQVMAALKLAIRQADVLAQPKERIVVLVGATGVGKTTTIAKLAAHEKIRLKRSVALISVDDYKVGGIDQLAHYARILEVPFIKTRQDLALEDQLITQHADTIFIDTFGISPSDTDRLEKLVKLLDFQDPELAKKLEIHLVIPAGVSGQDVHNLWESYQVLKPQYLLFTKWDETQSWGGMLATIMEANKPVSFLCHGQNVPDDMSLFSQDSFIAAVTEFNA